MLEQYRSASGNVVDAHLMYRLAHYYHTTEAAIPLSFLDMPFLLEIYRDMPTVPEMVAQKCTQVGWTEAGNVFGMMQTGVRGRRHAIVLPDDDMVKNFVQDRVQPMVERVAYYRELARVAHRTKHADNVHLRHLGHGSWRFVGSQKAAKLREFPTDSILVDEVDECNPANLPLVRDRVRNSSAPQLFWFGNPRRPGGGVSRMFENSDQREWYQSCTRCGFLQRVDWFENMVMHDEAGRWIPRDHERARHLTEQSLPGPATDIRPVCTRCKEPWSRVAARARWVIGNPGSARRGYHVSRMDHLGQSLWKLFREWVDAQEDMNMLAAFYSGALGLGFEPKGGQLTTRDLQACMTGVPMDYTGGLHYRTEQVVAGVDVGAVFNVDVAVLEQRRDDPTDPKSERFTCRRSVWVGAVKSWQELEDVLDRYHVRMTVIDAEPEHHAAQEFRDHCNRNTPHLVWLARYTDQPRIGALPYGMKLLMEDGRMEAQADKHALTDATVAEIRRGRREFPTDVELTLAWSDQMRAPIRKLVPTPQGERYRWERGPKRDDYRQADNYQRMAADILQMAGGSFDLRL